MALNKKTALVLSGGGMHGAFQVGALNALKDNWGTKVSASGSKMKFDIVAGVSAGALNGVLMAADRLDDLNNLWKQVGDNVEIVYKSDFIDTQNKSDKIKLKVDFASLSKKFLPNVNLKINFWQVLGFAIPGRFKKFINDLKTAAQTDFMNSLKSFKSIADNSPLAKTLADSGVKRNMIPQNVIYQCGYVSLDTGIYHSVQSTDFSSDEDFINGIVASTSIPIVWAPMSAINTQHQNPRVQHNCIDGGIRNSSPLGDVIKLINDDATSEYLIVIINNHNGNMLPENYDDKGIAQIALRSVFDIALSEIFMNDLSEFMDVNNILEQVEKQAPGTVIKLSGKTLRRFTAIVIQPEDPNRMGDALVATPEWIEKRKQYGYEQAMIAINGGAGPLVV
jgi:NTE family protein